MMKHFLRRFSRTLFINVVLKYAIWCISQFYIYLLITRHIFGKISTGKLFRYALLNLEYMLFKKNVMSPTKRECSIIAAVSKRSKIFNKCRKTKNTRTKSTVAAPASSSIDFREWFPWCRCSLKSARWCFEKAKYPNSGSQTLDVADKVHVQNLGPMDYSRQSVGQSGCAVVVLVVVLGI